MATTVTTLNYLTSTQAGNTLRDNGGYTALSYTPSAAVAEAFTSFTSDGTFAPQGGSSDLTIISVAGGAGGGNGNGCGGGAGGAYFCPPASGGTGGGGSAGPGNGINGTANTGGGGAGSGNHPTNNGGSGGSGKVVIKESAEPATNQGGIWNQQAHYLYVLTGKF